MYACENGYTDIVQEILNKLFPPTQKSNLNILSNEAISTYIDNPDWVRYLLFLNIIIRIFFNFKSCSINK